ncbi:MAG: hypothetical protein KGH50_02865 [Candidatus Micrarchaeota archaeon]|nr:hypothetical protein [Candidatus Micrarchaeota archaeon]
MSRRELSRNGALLKNGEIEAAKRALGIDDIKAIEARLSKLQDGSADSPQGRLIRSIRHFDSSLKTSKIEKARRKREAKQDHGTRTSIEEAVKKLKLAIEHSDSRERVSGYKETIEMLGESLSTLDGKAKAREKASAQEANELASLREDIRLGYYGSEDGAAANDMRNAAAGARRGATEAVAIGAGLLQQ